jgi:hypothetical protein
MSTIDDLLGTFNPVSLQEMEGVKLLNRVDTKFIFEIRKLPLLLNRLKDNYRILEVNGLRKSRYETLYYDTVDHKLYMHHHNGKLNRYKVRHRKYLDSNLEYFEIKFKNNKRRTIKKRILETQLNEQISGRSAEFLKEMTPLTPEMLTPAIKVSYTRITFVNIDMTERVTIDVDLSFKDSKQEKAFPGLIIAELKQDRTRHSEFQSIMKEEQVCDTVISKYCLGIISLNPQIKQNNFKYKLLQINKLYHDIN